MIVLATIVAKLSQSFLQRYAAWWRSSEVRIPFHAVPPLTLDNVFEAVKRVRRWSKLGEKLMGWYSWDSEDQKKLHAIRCRYTSDEARIKAVVEAFLVGKGEYPPSWRRVIHALHQAYESHLAERIKAYAEPISG